MKLLRRFSKRYYFRQMVAYFLVCCMFLNTSLPVVLAGPEGAQVVNGQVTFQQSGYNTTITASDRSIINYSSFDIARPEIVEFIQPGSSASVLNRILSANPTNINGTLLANGRVFFVNPAGVYIGAGARINVNQLVASGLNITNSDFINGQYNFAGGNGSVINAGDILAEKVYLIGKQVANSGNISCPAGYVVMAAGDRVFLGEPGSDIVLEIEETSLPELTEPVDSEPAVLNEGTIAAAGGTIVLAAEGDIYSQAISNVGSLSVSVETDDAGQIKLIAPQGQIVNSGTVDASGAMGGAVLIDGAYVQLTDSSKIHADGTEAGGEVKLLADTFNIAGEMTAKGTAEAHGHILIDPTIAYIDTVAASDTVLVSDIEHDLLHNTDVTVLAEETINVNAAIDTSGDDVATTTLSLNDDNIDGLGELTVNLNKSITLGVNQTLTGEATTVNVLAEDASIQNGIDVAASGAGINVSDGTYTEDLTVDKSDLTLRSVNGRNNTTIQLVDGVGIDIGSGGTGFTLGGGSSDGFEILSGSATTFNVQLKNAPSNVEISWNSFDTTNNSDNQGISVGAAGATGLNINNNTFKTDDVPGVGGVVWGDGSIWGPDMVDVLVTNNTFTGPAVHAASGYAVEFAGVTGTSLIQDNIISDYGMGVAIFNGTGTSGLTISDNDISDSTNGIRLGQYSPGVNGDMTTVTVMENTLTNNTIGLRINNGANVKASNFTIQNNSFSGNTKALANEHASENVTATQNYWGDVDGPGGIGPGSGDSITEFVADSVDYSPWWGGDYIGDPHVTAWTWGTNDSIQDAIDLAIASPTVSDRIYVTSGIYTEMINVNKQLDGLYFRGDGIVASEIDGTLTLSDAVASNTGVGIHTRNDGDITLNAIIDDGTHSLLVDTGNGTLNLDDNVMVGQDIMFIGDIIVAAGDLQATGTITLNGTANLAGDVTATGSDITFDQAVTANGAGLQTFDAGTGTLWAKSTIGKTGGALTLLGDTLVNLDGTVTGDSQVNVGNADTTAINAAANVEGVGVTFFAPVTADGVAIDQTFDATTGTLWAKSTIDKTTTGSLTLGGDTLVDLDGMVDVQDGSLLVTNIVDAEDTLQATGSITLNGTANLAGDVTATGSDITFDQAVTADGAGLQTFDAGTGTLWAKSTIDKTGGNLTLLGDTLIDLDGTVTGDSQVNVGNAGTTAINAAANVEGVGVTFFAPVTADGVAIDQTFDATTGTLWAKNTIDKTTTGSLTLGGDTLVDLDGTVDVQTTGGSLYIEDDTTVASGKMLKASSNVILADGKTLSGDNELTIIAGNEIKAQNATIKVSNSSLKLQQGVDLNLNNFMFGNQAATDLTLTSDNGSVTAVDGSHPTLDGKDVNAADKWKSITATADKGITLKGSNNITTKALTSTDNDISVHSTDGDLIVYGDITADPVLGDVDPVSGDPLGGGVSLISDKGKIYTPGSTVKDKENNPIDALNVTITGYSDGAQDKGVSIPNPLGDEGIAAIVIVSEDNLAIGAGSKLTAKGVYDPTNDERADSILEEDGFEIDVAIYLRSVAGNVTLGSTVSPLVGPEIYIPLEGPGALVVDAYDTVTFNDSFEDFLMSPGSPIKRIDVVSRITETLNTAVEQDRLPHGSNPQEVLGLWNNFGLGFVDSIYVLRGENGGTVDFAWLLGTSEPVPLVLPAPLEPEDKGEVEETDKEALMQWLVDELGEGNVQTYLARAYPPSLHTDLRPYKAAARLQNFAAILKDPAGAHIAALGQVIGEVIQADVPPSPEQSAMIVQGFAEHVGDDTHYALAGQWIDALAEYTGTLNSEIGWSTDKSIAFVMGKYGSGIRESGDLRIAMFVQTYLEQSFGG